MARIKHIYQPEGSGLCGQACIAMAAGVTLADAIDVVGHENPKGTYTREVVASLMYLGVRCAPRLKRVSRSRPTLPPRAIVAIHRPERKKKCSRWHWMLTWDGKMYDPGGCWPDAYRDWRITSYLEIFK